MGDLVDGWAHRNLELEGYYPLFRGHAAGHALYYSGFAACAAWIGWQVLRARESGRRGRAAFPAGYGLGLVGVALFALGYVGNLTWHTVLGPEKGVAQYLSPPHLLRVAGTMLMVTVPLRAAWAARDDRDAGRLRTFLLPVLSLTVVTAEIAHYTLYFSPFVNIAPTMSEVGWQAAQYRGPYPGDDYFAIQGIGSALVTNVVLLMPTLYLLKRWEPPFGAFTVLFTVVAGLMNVISGFSTAVTILPALVGGLAADVLTRRLRPSVTRPGALTAFAVLVPAVLWPAYYLTLAATSGLTWDIELPTGLIILNSLAGFALAHLMLPVRDMEPPRAV